MGLEFRKAIGSMHLDRINVVPLLHADNFERTLSEESRIVLRLRGGELLRGRCAEPFGGLLVNQNMPELSGVWIVDPVAPRIVGPTNAENIRS